MNQIYENEITFEIVNGILKKYHGTNSSVVIPANVRKINHHGFSGCATLKSIVIPETVMEIDYDAFYCCMSLSEIHYAGTKKQWKAVKKHCNWRMCIPAKLVHCTDGNIKLSQFDIKYGYICKYFGINPEVIIPENVRGILGYGFSDCTTLKSIVIPENVTEISHYAFSGCTSLSEIHFTGTKEQWKAVEKDEDWRRNIPARFVQCKDGNIELPKFDIKEGGVLQRYFGIDPAVIIPDGVTKIGEEAFLACRLLKSITIPDTVTEICNVAFYGCLFESLSIPNKVTKICDGAFSFCSVLKSVMIPVSVMEIGRGAFFECPLLSEIHYAGSIEQWKTVKKGWTWRWHTLAKFVQCTDGIVRLPQFYIKKGVLKKYLGSEPSVVIPNNVIKIGERAIFHRRAIVSVSLPNGLKEIGDEAFSFCGELESVKIPDGVTSIGNNAFTGCKSLVSINIPTSVQKIGEGIFSGCPFLEEKVN